MSINNVKIQTKISWQIFLVVGVLLLLTVAVTKLGFLSTIPSHSVVGLVQASVGLETFGYFQSIELPASLRVPGVVSLVLPEESVRNSWASPNVAYIYEVQTETMVGVTYLSKEDSKPVFAECMLLNADSTTSCDQLIDDNPNTVSTLAIQDQIPTTTSYITLKMFDPTDSIDGFRMRLEKNSEEVATVSVATNGVESRTLIQNKQMPISSILFPSARAETFVISLEHWQPLVIADIYAEGADAVDSSLVAYFTANPEYDYVLYADPEVIPTLPFVEPPRNINQAKEATLATKPVRNELYVPSDRDADGVIDKNDNCAYIANADQSDEDRNGVGDLCDDYDGDRVLNHQDNCPDQPNVNQMDSDADGLGDVCDKQESRVTERYTWLPWAAIGVTGVFLVIMMGLLLMNKSDKTIQSGTQSEVAKSSSGEDANNSKI